jgi:hypothetical protein
MDCPRRGLSLSLDASACYPAPGYIPVGEAAVGWPATFLDRSDIRPAPKDPTVPETARGIPVSIDEAAQRPLTASPGPPTGLCGARAVRRRPVTACPAQRKPLSTRDTLLRTLVLLFALSLMPPERGNAQQPSLPAWLVLAGGTALEFRNDKKWGFGPTLGVRRMLSTRMSLDLDVSALVTNSGPDKFTGVFGNFGPSLVWRDERYDVSVSVGVLAGTLWEESGGQASTLGLFGALGGAYWFGPVGLSGRAAYHIWYGEPGASVHAGLALRW